MRPVGETSTVPLMELERTNDGEAAAYAPMEIEARSDDGEHGGVLPEDPLVIENGEKEVRGADTAAYFRRYHQMRPSGFTRAISEYECPRERLADYNLGWLSGCARGLSTLYSGQRASYGKPTHKWTKRGYMRGRAIDTHGLQVGIIDPREWALQEEPDEVGVIGCLGRTWDIADADE